MGAGHNRLLLYTHEGKAWVRAAGTWDPDAVARRPRLRGRGARGAARVLGPGRRRAPEPAPPARGAHRLTATPRALVVGSGPNGLAAAIRLAEAGWPVDRARGRRRTTAARCARRSSRCRASGTTRSRRSTRRPPRRRCSRACRSSATGCGGRTRAPATRTRCPGGRAIALYRDLDRTAASLDAAGAPGDGEGWRAFAAPLLEQCGRRARRDAQPVPAGRAGAAAARRGSGRCGRLDFLRLVPGTARASAGACSRAATRARGSTAPRGTATRAVAIPAAGSPSPTSTCSATPSAGRARRAAPDASPTRSSPTCASSAARSAAARRSRACTRPAGA